jgi:peroxiredoxin
MGVQAYESPKPAPAFALPTLDGRTMRLEDLKGKAVLLFFWATW